MPDPCPTRDELAMFAAGDLSRAALERVARHAEGCDRCGLVLDELDERPDPLLDGLRTPAAGPGSEWSVPDGVRTALLNIGAGTPPVPGPAVGARLGKFELVELLGVGTFGKVFKAIDTELDRPVAVKVLRGGTGADHQDADALPPRGPQCRPAAAPGHRRPPRHRPDPRRLAVLGRGVRPRDHARGPGQGGSR